MKNLHKESPPWVVILTHVNPEQWRGDITGQSRHSSAETLVMEPDVEAFDMTYLGALVRVLS